MKLNLTVQWNHYVKILLCNDIFADAKVKVQFYIIISKGEIIYQHVKLFVDIVWMCYTFFITNEKVVQLQTNSFVLPGAYF